MGLLNKLAFWKKKDDFGLGDIGSFSEEGKSAGMPPSAAPSFEKDFGAEPAGFPEEPGAHPMRGLTSSPEISEEPTGPDFGTPPGGPAPVAASPPLHAAAPPMGNRDIELLSAKLDFMGVQTWKV